MEKIIRVYYKSKTTWKVWYLDYRDWFEWWKELDKRLRKGWKTFLYSTIISCKKAPRTRLVYQKLNDLRNSGKLKKHWND